VFLHGLGKADQTSPTLQGLGVTVARFGQLDRNFVGKFAFPADNLASRASIAIRFGSDAVVLLRVTIRARRHSDEHHGRPAPICSLAFRATTIHGSRPPATKQNSFCSRTERQIGPEACGSMGNAS